MENLITQTLQSLDMTAVAVLLICSVTIAVLTELIKQLDPKGTLKPSLIQGLTLLLGQTLAVVFAVITGGEWQVYVIIGLASSVMSSGIYEWVSKTFSILKGE